jgi:hypothetical protein
MYIFFAYIYPEFILLKKYNIPMKNWRRKIAKKYNYNSAQEKHLNGK